MRASSFRTPRILVHRWLASTTQPTPLAPERSMRDAIRGADQPGTLRVLANLSKQGSDGALDLLAIALRVHPRDASSQPSGGGRAAQARRPHRSLPPERTNH